jgi:hypothetical protein
MNKWGFFLVAGIIAGLGACTTDQGADPVPAPAPAAAPATPPEDADSVATPSACDLFDPGEREWFELEETGGSFANSPVIAGYTLPAASASRYNTVLEICPNLWFVLTHDGESRLLDLETGVWSPGPTLSPSGATNQIPAPGVDSGGPTWGFRDSTLGDDQVYLSDGVIDTAAECVRVDVHALNLSDLLSSPTEDTVETTVIYRSTPCVSYTDDWRSASPLRTHLGGALGISPGQDSLLLTIGDFHLAASSISQAVAIGLANTETDYDILASETAAVGALIEIPLQGGPPQIVAKGLRNSLGITATAAGSVWMSDHGPSGGDELNFYTQGANYGWPLTTQGEPYDRSSWPNDPNQLLAPWLDNGDAVVPGTTPPTLWWTPAIAPTAVVDISGESAETSLLALGGLRSEAIIVVALTDGVAEELTRIRLGERVRDMAGNQAGSLLVAVTDQSTLWVLSAENVRGS